MTSGKSFLEVLGTFCRTFQELPEDIAVTSGKRFLEVLGTFCRTFQECPEDIAVTSGKRFLDVLGTLFKDVKRTHHERSSFSNARCAFDDL